MTLFFFRVLLQAGLIADAFPGAGGAAFTEWA